MQLQRYGFFLNHKKKNKFLYTHTYFSTTYVYISSILVTFFLPIEKKFVLLQLKNLKKNEENIPTITQKKSQ